MPRYVYALVLATAVVAALSVVDARSSRAQGRLLAWKNLAAQVGPVEFSGPEQHSFRQQQDLATFLRHVETGRRFRIPSVDFSRYEVVCFAVGPRSSSAYRLAVRDVRALDGRIEVRVDERSPSLRAPGRPRLTFPFVLVRIPRSDAPVSVVWPQEP